MRRSIARPWLVLLLTLGCGDDVRGDADEAGDSGSDGSDSGAEDRPGGDPADPIPDICERFLECVEAVRGSTLAANERKYGPGGTCWQEGPAETAVCVTACGDALAELHRDAQCEPACMVCTSDDECDTVAGEFCIGGGCELVPSGGDPFCPDE